jgi:SAM-dependent methyltransferase
MSKKWTSFHEHCVFPCISKMSSLVSTAISSSFTLDYGSIEEEDYQKHRPPYRDSLYKIIFDYHSTHGGQWNSVHDVGTGAGMVASKLSQYFSRIFASDVSQTYIENFRSRIKNDGLDRKFTLNTCRGEDMATWIKAESLDMVTVAEAIHWTDVQETVNAAAKVLRPGGTLAIWLYGTGFVTMADRKVDEIVGHIMACVGAQGKSIPIMDAAYALVEAQLDPIIPMLSDFNFVEHRKW